MVCVGGWCEEGLEVGVRESGQPNKQEKALGTEMRTSRSMQLEHGQQWGGEQKTRPDSTRGRFWEEVFRSF